VYRQCSSAFGTDASFPVKAAVFADAGETLALDEGEERWSGIRRLLIRRAKQASARGRGWRLSLRLSRRLMAAADTTAVPRKQASDQAYHVFGSIGRGGRISVTVGRRKVRISAFSGLEVLDGAAAAPHGGGGRRGLVGYVVTRAGRRRRMRSRRRWVTPAVTMTSVTAIDSAMGSHGVSSDGLGERGSVSGSGSP
jgi:hypothetical protein